MEFASTKRNDITFLEGLKTIKVHAALKEHIFKGKMTKKVDVNGNPTWSVSGIHHKSAFTTKTNGFVNGDVRKKSGHVETPDPSGSGAIHYKKLEMYDHDKYILQQNSGLPEDQKGWTTKDESTFFPGNWSEKKILEESAVALSNKVIQPDIPNSPNHKYVGTASNGMKVQIFINKTTGIIESIYPFF